MNVTRYREASPISSPRRTHSSSDNGGANANRQESKGSRDALTETLFQFLICSFSDETRRAGGGASGKSHQVNVINILYLMLVIMLSLLGNSNENSNISSYSISEINRRTQTTTTLTL